MTGRVLRNGLPGLIALILGVAAFAFVQPLVVASFGGASALDAIMSRIPPALQVVARLSPEFLAMSGLMGYLSLGFTHPLYILLAGAAIVGFAARSLAGEMDRGIAHIALSRPVSRHAAYLARALGAVIICILLALAGPAGMAAGVLYARPDGEFAYGHLVPVAVTAFALFWAIAGFSLCVSAASSSAGRIVGLVLGLLVVSYFVDYFAEIWPVLEPLTVFSIFTYFDPTHTLVTGALLAENVAILLVTGTLTAVAGLVIFVGRDLPA